MNPPTPDFTGSYYGRVDGKYKAQTFWFEGRQVEEKELDRLLKEKYGKKPV